MGPGVVVPGFGVAVRSSRVAGPWIRITHRQHGGTGDLQLGLRFGKGFFMRARAVANSLVLLFAHFTSRWGPPTHQRWNPTSSFRCGSCSSTATIRPSSLRRTVLITIGSEMAVQEHASRE
jgi:hypothetical protein